MPFSPKIQSFKRSAITVFTSLFLLSGKFDAAVDMICFNAKQAQSSLRAFRGVGHFER